MLDSFKCVRVRVRVQTQPSVPVYRFNVSSTLTVTTGVLRYLQVKLCAAVPVKLTELNLIELRVCVDLGQFSYNDLLQTQTFSQTESSDKQPIFTHQAGAFALILPDSNDRTVCNCHQEKHTGPD